MEGWEGSQDLHLRIQPLSTTCHVQLCLREAGEYNSLGRGGKGGSIYVANVAVLDLLQALSVTSYPCLVSLAGYLTGSLGGGFGLSSSY